MAIERMAEEKFAQIMGRVLSPSRAIESPELLKGRDDQPSRDQNSSVRASEKNNKWYLVLNTNKEALKAAPGFTYDKTKTTWMPAAK